MNNIPAHFEVYKDKSGQWRWRLRAAGNSAIIADSAEGYVARADCMHGIALVKQLAPSAWTWDVETGKWV